LRSKILPPFTLVDWVLCAVMAALGLAVKVVVVPLVHTVTAALFIPGGAVAGGLYMLFVVLGAVIVRKPGAATLIALVQAVVVFVTGMPGSQGALSLLTYTLPGVGVDVLVFVLRERIVSLPACFAAGVVANVLGTYAVSVALFRLPALPLALSLVAAALSGGVGGVLACALARRLRRLGLIGGDVGFRDGSAEEQDEDSASLKREKSGGAQRAVEANVSAGEQDS